MQRNLLLCLLIVTLHPLCAQRRILVSGTVTTDGSTKKPISVINYQTKLIVNPKANGQFEIWAKKDDLLIFMLDDYLDQQLTVGDEELKGKINIVLKPKPIELDEVKIDAKPLKAFKVSQAELDEIKLKKDAQKPVVQGVYTGETVNGMDFVRMAKGLVNLFRKKDNGKKPKPVVDFKEYLNANIKEDFYTKTLGLDPERISGFIDYCNNDPQAKTVAQNENPMVLIDFLINKSTAFKKL